MYDAGRLVEVQERGAQEDERREDHVGDEEGGPGRVLRLRLEEDAERQARDGEQDHECRQRAGRVDVVGAAEPDGAADRRPDAHALEQRDRHDEPREREPRDRRERKPGQQHGDAPLDRPLHREHVRDRDGKTER